MGVAAGVDVCLACTRVVGGGRGFGRVVSSLFILEEFKWDGESIELGNACGVGNLWKGVILRG